MKRMGVRELKDNFKEALDEVANQGQIIEVTKHGRPIARLVPALNGGAIDWDANGAWTALNNLREQLKDQWPEGASAQDIINDVRG